MADTDTDTATTLYALHEGGAVSKIVHTDGDQLLPDGVELISAEEYEGHLADIQAVNDRHVAGLVAAETEEKRHDYEALRALKVPEATARRITGYLKEEA